MNREKFVSFIKKYHLDGLVNSAILTFKDSKLSTRFTNGDKSILGMIELDNWDFEPGDFGVYDAGVFVKLIEVLDNDIEMKISRAGDKAISIQVSDKNSKIQYMLSDTTLINQPPVPEKLPTDFDLKIEVNKQFIDKFKAGTNALPETETYSVLTNNGETQVVIGYSTVGTNRVTLPVTTTEYSDLDLISFNAKHFKSVLNANSKCESALLEISPSGLSKITFKFDDFRSEYYLVAVQDVD